LKKYFKYFLLLGILNIILLTLGLAIKLIFKINIVFGDLAVQTLIFSLITLITLTVFFKGQTKEADSRTFYVLVAISLKFLLEMIFALFWFLVVKKCYNGAVLTFFVLYLSLTSFSIFIMLKTLKNKAL
jgi:hypothetical protein